MPIIFLTWMVLFSGAADGANTNAKPPILIRPGTFTTVRVDQAAILNRLPLEVIIRLQPLLLRGRLRKV
jgi:hypothetical protein